FYTLQPPPDSHIYTLSLHDALPILAPYLRPRRSGGQGSARSRPANHLYYSMTSLLSHLRTHLARTRLLGDPGEAGTCEMGAEVRDRKSTRLNSSHVSISYAVFCLKK